MKPGELPKPACRAAQKYRGVDVSSNGDERPLNSCPSLLFFRRMIWITFCLVSQGPQPDRASVAHRVNQVSDTLFDFSSFVVSLSLLPSSWFPGSPPRTHVQASALLSSHTEATEDILTDETRGEEGCRKLSGNVSTLTAMFTVKCLWDHRNMTSAKPTELFCLFCHYGPLSLACFMDTILLRYPSYIPWYCFQFPL